MKKEMNIRVCKKCHKVLPDGYKYKRCEACRNKQAQGAKNGLKILGGGLGSLACIAVVIITRGNVNLKK